MKRSITAVAALAAVLLISGCDFLVGPDEPAGGGNLVIGFGEHGSRAAAPTAEEQAALRYELVLTGPGGQIKTVSLALLAPGETFSEQAALGEWHISAKAYDSGNTLIGTGSAAVMVGPGVNQVWIRMETSSYYSISLSETGTWTFPPANEGYGAQAPQTITVSNTGNEETGDLTAGLSGADSGSFELDRTTINSIGVSGTDTFTVVPKTSLAAGTYTAAVTVSGGIGISPDFTVSFTVNNTMPPADVTLFDGTPGNGGVTLTWTDPADADLDHIEITWSPADGMSQPISVAQGTQTATITGLTNGTPYTFTAEAVDTAGNRSFGVSSAALTPLAPTGNITVDFSGLPQDETITLGSLSSPSWEANTPLTVSVNEPFAAYRWSLDGVAVPGETSSGLTLYAGNLEIKQHTLTVFVKKNGIEYAKAVTFTVTL
jgi:methionine-rich copper-binding protein CopC